MSNLAVRMGVRLAILENRILLREGLVWAFEHSDIRVVAQTGDRGTFLRAVRRTRPNTVIVEFFVCGKDTPQLIADALSIQPGLKSIVLASGAGPKLMQQCMNAGATGCIDRLNCPFEIVGLIHAANQDMFTIPRQPSGVLSPGTVSRSLSDVLSKRELEVLQYIAIGADNLKISAHLMISERTVKAHVHAIYQKLGIENRTQLALFALQRGIPPVSGV